MNNNQYAFSSLTPVVQQAVAEAETTGLPGIMKHVRALAITQQAYEEANGANATNVEFADIEPSLSKMVEAWVDYFNTIGSFQHTPAMAA